MPLVFGKVSLPLLRPSQVALIALLLCYFLNTIGHAAIVYSKLPIFYFLKHASLVACAFLAIRYCKYRPKELFFLGLFLFMHTPLLFKGPSGQIIYFQKAFFIFACSFLSLAWNEKIGPREILLLVLIFILPTLIDLVFNQGDFIYSAVFFGRPRLILGFFHPREAGLACLSLILFILLSNGRAKWILVLLLSVLLYFINSRNALLSLILITVCHGALSLVGHTSIYLVSMSGIIMLGWAVTFFYPGLHDPFIKKLDIMLSERITFWTKNKIEFWGELSEIGQQFKSFALYKKNYDNFLIESLQELGLPFTIIGLIFFSSVMLFFKIKDFRGIKLSALLIMMIFYSFFGSGMFSTGNIVNIIVWSVLFYNFKDYAHARV